MGEAVPNSSGVWITKTHLFVEHNKLCSVHRCASHCAFCEKMKPHSVPPPPPKRGQAPNVICPHWREQGISLIWKLSRSSFEKVFIGLLVYVISARMNSKSQAAISINKWTVLGLQHYVVAIPMGVGWGSGSHYCHSHLAPTFDFEIFSGNADIT